MDIAIAESDLALMGGWLRGTLRVRRTEQVKLYFWVPSLQDDHRADSRLSRLADGMVKAQAGWPREWPAYLRCLDYDSIGQMPGWTWNLLRCRKLGLDTYWQVCWYNAIDWLKWLLQQATGYGFAKKKAELLISTAQKHRPWGFILVPMNPSLFVPFKCFVHYLKAYFKLRKQ